MVEWIIYFVIYAFIGWFCEEVYCSIGQKKLVYRGFLYGPICPIYGFGGVAVLYLLNPLKQHWYLVLLIGIFITTSLEYITSYLMEKLFKMRWWDYSHYKFNIKGRVCLLNSSLFGLLCLIMVYGVHPFISRSVSVIPSSYQMIIAIIILSIITIDTILSIHATLKVKGYLEKYSALMKEKMQLMESHIETKVESLEVEFNSKINVIKQKVKNLIDKNKYSNFSLYRLTKKFPDLSYTKTKLTFKKIKEEIEKNMNRDKKH